MVLLKVGFDLPRAGMNLICAAARCGAGQTITAQGREHAPGSATLGAGLRAHMTFCMDARCPKGVEPGLTVLQQDEQVSQLPLS